MLKVHNLKVLIIKSFYIVSAMSVLASLPLKCGLMTHTVLIQFDSYLIIFYVSTRISCLHCMLNSKVDIQKYITVKLHINIVVHSNTFGRSRCLIDKPLQFKL